MIHNQIDSTALPSWTRDEDKLFERALVAFPEETPGRWAMIASQVPGKSSADVQRRYEDLVRDLREIEAGRVELPSYDDDEQLDSPSGRGGDAEFGARNTSKERETERRKGVPWTEEEHRLFLIGLEKYGRGDWRSISRNAVVSRTPTQVASHAQKYFIRLRSDKKDKKRSSIHDITNVDADDSLSQPKDQNYIGPLTDQFENQQLGFPAQAQPGFNDQGHPLGGYQGFGFPM